MRTVLGWEPLIGYFAYIIGAILFNVNTGLGFNSLNEFQEKVYVWLPAVVGSVLFSLGGGLECYHNKIWKWNCGNPTHWLSLFNFVGGLLFLWAGVAGIIGVADEHLSMLMIDLTYLLGSACFLFGGVIALWMWKG
jgi:hypothetical protein